MNMNTSAAIRQYQNVKAEGAVTDASAHQLIELLLDAAVSRLGSAESALGHGDVARRGEHISRVLAIVDNLRASLDMEAGGDIASNLRGLYDYIEQRLLEANIEGDGVALGEVRTLFRELLEGWRGIPEASR